MKNTYHEHQKKEKEKDIPKFSNILLSILFIEKSHYISYWSIFRSKQTNHISLFLNHLSDVSSILVNKDKCNSIFLLHKIQLEVFECYMCTLSHTLVGKCKVRTHHKASLTLCRSWRPLPHSLHNQTVSIIFLYTY